MSWTPKTQQAEAWTAKSKQAEVWAEKTRQAEAWTAELTRIHVFDPAVFDPTPIFDTYAAGLWIDSAQTAEVWIAA